MTDQSPFLPDEEEQEDLRVPWSFRLVVVLTVIYLAYRLVQGVVWVIERIG